MAHAHPTPHDRDCCGHTASPAQRLRAAEALCAQRGVRLTEQRRIVLQALLETERAVGAYDLIDRVAARAGKRVAPITIYRALDFLVDTGLVHRIESRNAFLACPGTGGHVHEGHAQAVFMICETCGRVSEATSASLEKEIVRLAGVSGFAPKLRVIELTGLCAECVTTDATAQTEFQP